MQRILLTCRVNYLHREVSVLVSKVNGEHSSHAVRYIVKSDTCPVLLLGIYWLMLFLHESRHFYSLCVAVWQWMHPRHKRTQTHMLEAIIYQPLWFTPNTYILCEEYALLIWLLFSKKTLVILLLFYSTSSNWSR